VTDDRRTIDRDKVAELQRAGTTLAHDRIGTFDVITYEPEREPGVYRTSVLRPYAVVDDAAQSDLLHDAALMRVNRAMRDPLFRCSFTVITARIDDRYWIMTALEYAVCRDAACAREAHVEAVGDVTHRWEARAS